MFNITTEIPVIDVTQLTTAKSLQELRLLAKRVYDIYSKIGFAYIVNHNISEILLDAIFEQSRLFHHLPEKEKMKILQNKFYRGYMPFGASTLKVSTLGTAVKANQSSAFILMQEIDKADSDYIKGINLAGPNQWPSEELLPNFKPILQHYREEFTILAKNLVRLFALALDQEYYAFDHYFNYPTNYLRLQYYPAQPDLIPEDQYGIAPHTDYGFFTLLLQDEVGGLQVQSQDNRWIDVTPLKGGIVMNTGDMLRYISNNKIISTPHRVINTSGRERYSIPFFFEPDMKSSVKKIGTFDDVGIKYSEYTMDRVLGNYNIGAEFN